MVFLLTNQQNVLFFFFGNEIGNIIIQWPIKINRQPLWYVINVNTIKYNNVENEISLSYMIQQIQFLYSQLLVNNLYDRRVAIVYELRKNAKNILFLHYLRKKGCTENNPGRKRILLMKKSAFQRMRKNSSMFSNETWNPSIG